MRQAQIKLSIQPKVLADGRLELAVSFDCEGTDIELKPATLILSAADSLQLARSIWHVHEGQALLRHRRADGGH